MIPFARMLTYGNKAPGIKKLTSSTLHVGILGDNGKMYMRGTGTNYHLGTGNLDNVMDRWVEVPYSVDDCWLSNYGTIIRTKDGKLFSVGLATMWGVPGLHTDWTEVTSLLSPLDIRNIKNIEMTAVSTNGSVLLLMNDNSLYGMGYNSGSVLGVSGIKTAPVLIDNDVSMIGGNQVSQNAFHYIKNGVYFRCGTNVTSNLGSSGNLTVFTPLILPEGSTALNFEIYNGATKILVQESDDTYSMYFSGSNSRFVRGDTDITGTLAVFTKLSPLIPLVANSLSNPGGVYVSIVFNHNGFYTAGSSTTGLGRTLPDTDINAARGFYGAIEFVDNTIDINRVSSIVQQSNSSLIYCIINNELYWAGNVSYFLDEDAVAPNYKFRKMINYPKF